MKRTPLNKSTIPTFFAFINSTQFGVSSKTYTQRIRLMEWQVLPANMFENYIGQWDDLNLHGPNSPVLNSAFIKYSLEEFGTGKEVLAIFGDTKNPRAMTILNKAKFGVWDTFQPSQAPLGFWLNSSNEDLTNLLKNLAKALPGIILKIGITQQDPDIYSRPEHKNKISTLDYIQTARVETNIAFTEYWASRGKNLRHNLKRQRNRLKKEDVEIILEVQQSPEKVIDAIAAYGKLESAGWKASGGTAIAIDNSQGRFYTSLLKEFCSRGQGYIYQYFYNDNLVATDLCIAQNGTVVILKTTYDESLSTSSPAFLMRQESFELLFSDEKINRIEFYGKMMEWHTKWSSDKRILYHLNFRRF